MLEYHAQFISKIVLALVAPHCAIAFLARPDARNPSAR